MPWVIRIRGELHKVENKTTIIVGRSEECDIQVQSRSVDQRHAEMVYVPEKKTYFVKDLRSVNGTFINERRLPSGGSMEIKALDIVKLGYDMNVLRIEGLPSELPSTKTQDFHTAGPPSATTPVSAPYVLSPTPSTLPQPAPGMPVQYIAIQPIQQSPTQAPLLPAAQGGVSYVPMTYYMPVSSGGMSGIPIDPSTIQVSASQQAFSHVAPPMASSVPSLMSDQLPHRNQIPPSTYSGQSFPPSHPPTSQTQERLFHPVGPTHSVGPTHPVDPPPGPHQLKHAYKDTTMVGELTMALIDLDSDTEVGATPSGQAQLTPHTGQRGRMPNFDSDVSSNFTSVSKQEESEPEKPISRSSSLKREDGRRSVVVSKSSTLPQNTSVLGQPVWWTGEEEHVVRSRSSSTNSEDILDPSKLQKVHVKRGKKALSSATYEVRSTDDGFSAGDEGSDSNVDNRTTIISHTEMRSAEVTVTLPEVSSERPDTAQTLVASTEVLSPPSAAVVEEDSSLLLLSVSNDADPHGGSNDNDRPPVSLMDDAQHPPVAVTTSWHISCDDDNAPKTKGRRSMPALTSLAKRLTPAKKPEAKVRKSVSSATGASKVTKGSTVKGTQSSRSPLHSLVSTKRQVDVKGKVAQSSVSASSGSAVKGAGSGTPGRRTPQGQTGMRKEAVTKSVSASTRNTPQRKTFTKTETAVTGKGQRSSSPFTRSAADRRTYTKKEGASTPDLPRINKQHNRRTSASMQTTPKSGDSHVTSITRGSAVVQRPPVKGQNAARKGETDKELNTTVILVDAAHEKDSAGVDQSIIIDLSPRKVVGEEDAGGNPSDNRMSPAAEEEVVEDPPSVISIPTGVDSLIVASHFGEVQCEAHDGDGVPHVDRVSQGRPGGVGGSSAPDGGVLERGPAGREDGAVGPSGTEPLPDLSTPVFGPATSSPKQPLSTATRTEGLSPVPLELEDTPTGTSSALGNHTEVVGVEKGRVSSARRRWQKSQTPGLDGLVLASMGTLSEQVNRMSEVSLDQVVCLKRDMEVHGVLPTEKGGSDTTCSFEIEGSDQPPAWMASHQELAQVFQHLLETEKRLKEVNQMLTVMSKKSQFHTQRVAVTAAEDSVEQLREEQVHSLEVTALGNAGRKETQ